MSTIDLESRRLKKTRPAAELEPPPGRFDDEKPVAQLPPPLPTATTIPDVLRQWSEWGPLVHEPTGIAKLDEITSGGLVYGVFHVVAGAPNVGKTALANEIADDYARRGIAVGIYTPDEEPSDGLTRFAQRAGFARTDCEARDKTTLTALADEFATLPIRFYDTAHTVESAAADLAAFAKENKTSACFIIDSLQTGVCEAVLIARNPSEYQIISANVKAAKKAVTCHRMIGLGLSEMNRGAYRSQDAAEQTNDMAAAKGSGNIEYGARLLLTLRSVKSEPDAIEVRVPKNKLGQEGETFFLKIDRRRMTVSGRDAPAVATTKSDAGGFEKDAPTLVKIILNNPGIGSSALRTKAKVASLGGPESVNALVEYCEQNGLVVDRSEQKGKRVDHHYFVPSKTTGEVGES